MPKALSDRDRILAFAFRASTEELVDAIAVLKAAHAAKATGRGAPRSVATRKRAAVASTDTQNGPSGQGD